MIYNISNKFLSLSVKSFGAELCSLKKVNSSKEYIWQGDASYWARHAPILFPIVGKLKNNEYKYENEKYTLTQHGFARDMEFELFCKDDNFLEFKLTYSIETLKIYPFKFDLYVKYTLEENNVKITYKVKNIDSKKIYFSIGSHIAFNCDILNDENFFLEFDDIKSTTQYFLNDGIIDNEKTYNFLNNKINLNKNIFKDDAIIFNDKNINQVKLTDGKDFNLHYEFNDFPYLGIWSKPSGAPFVCIEPWYGIADFKNASEKIEEKIGINVLEIGDEFEISQTVKIFETVINQEINND